MCYRLYVSSCFFLILFLFHASSPFAAQRVVLQHQPRLAETLFAANSPQSVDTLRKISSHIDTMHIQHTRLQQEYAGIVVRGGYVIEHTPAAQRQQGFVTGAIYRDLAADLGPMRTNFTSNAAQFLREFKESFVNDTILASHVMPLIDIDNKHKAFWAYQVSVLLRRANGTMARPCAIINAVNHTIVREWDDLKTLRRPVAAQGFSGNEKIGKQQYGVTLPLLDIVRDDYLQQCYMENSDVKVLDLMHDYRSPNNAMEFTCNNNKNNTEVAYWTGYNSNGYDEVNGAYSVANDALYIGGVVKNMYAYYHAPLFSTKRVPLIMRIHYGKNYENAFWDGKVMTFGDGNINMYPLVSLGIAAHEISHGFTEKYSNLEYYGQSGGMNEAFSDMAAQAAEYYTTKHNSWKIGEEILKITSGMQALRFMDLPSRDGRSIDNAKQYKRGMDVHYTSGVYNRLFYLLSKQWGVTRAFQLMIKANMDYWIPTSSFAEGACGLLEAADQLHLPVTTLKTALISVAIVSDDCVGVQQ